MKKIFFFILLLHNAGFKEGLAAVSLGELYGYIDKTGKVAIPIKYSYASDFENGKLEEDKE